MSDDKASTPTDAIDRALRRLNWGQMDLAREAGLSDAKIRDIQRGRRDVEYRASTLGKVEDALGWHPGSLRRMLGGEDYDPEAEREEVTGRGGQYRADPTSQLVGIMAQLDETVRNLAEEVRQLRAEQGGNDASGMEPVEGTEG